MTIDEPNGEFIAMPSQSGELRRALPVLLELWSKYIGGTMEVRLGFGTESDQDLYAVRQKEPLELEAFIEECESNEWFQYGQGDLFVAGPGFHCGFCHEGDFHIESQREAVMATARAAFAAMGIQSRSRGRADYNSLAACPGAMMPGGNSSRRMFRKWIFAPSDSRHRYPFFCVDLEMPFTNLPLMESLIVPSTATTS